MRRHWHWRRKRFYIKNRWHLVLDLALGVVIILLITVVLTMHYYQPDLSRLLSFRLDNTERIDLNNPPLKVNFSVVDRSLNIGDGILFKVDLENTYSRKVSNVKIDLEPINNFSVTKIEQTGAGSDFEIKDKKIILDSLAANQDDQADFRVYFKSGASGQKTINWQAELEYIVKGQVVKESFPLTSLNIVSDLSVSSVAYYNSPQGDQLGAGPLPPIAYLPTNYWIFWNVVADGNFEDFVMTAQLPIGVELTDSQSLLAGELNYNSSSRKIIWQVNELKDQIDNYRVGFEVQLVPEEEQIGKILPLIKGVKYYANDKLTNKEVAEQIGDLTTNLDFDKINKGQGKVIDQ